MTSEEKIAFTKNQITEKAALSPSGPFYIDLLGIVEAEAFDQYLDEAPTES